MIRNKDKKYIQKA